MKQGTSLLRVECILPIICKSISRLDISLSIPCSCNRCLNCPCSNRLISLPIQSALRFAWMWTTGWWSGKICKERKPPSGKRKTIQTGKKNQQNDVTKMPSKNLSKIIFLIVLNKAHIYTEPLHSNAMYRYNRQKVINLHQLPQQAPKKEILWVDSFCTINFSAFWLGLLHTTHKPYPILDIPVPCLHFHVLLS